MRRPSAARRRPELHRSPSRLTIAAGMTRSVGPSGKPHRARTCCSNWLVTPASIVKCPELCGRGAISLTSSRPSAVKKELDGQDADGAQRLGHGQGQPVRLLGDDRPDRRRA